MHAQDSWASIVCEYLIWASMHFTHAGGHPEVIEVSVNPMDADHSDSTANNLH